MIVLVIGLIYFIIELPNLRLNKKKISTTFQKLGYESLRSTSFIRGKLSTVSSFSNPKVDFYVLTYYHLNNLKSPEGNPKTPQKKHLRKRIRIRNLELGRVWIVRTNTAVIYIGTSVFWKQKKFFCFEKFKVLTAEHCTSSIIPKVPYGPKKASEIL